MSEVIDTGRGSHKMVKLNTGAVITPYIELHRNIKLPEQDNENNQDWLLTDFRFHFMEKNAIVQCFNEINHVYAFGHDPENSSFSISYTVFLGDNCMKHFEFKQSDALKGFLEVYVAKRLSIWKKVVEITTVEGTVLYGLLLGFDVSVIDEEMHMVNVTFSGKCVRYKAS